MVTGDENAASDVEYRCIFVHNNHATLTLQGVVVWLSAEVAGGSEPFGRFLPARFSTG